MAKRTGFEVDEEGQIQREYTPRDTRADRADRGKRLSELADRLIGLRDLGTVPLGDRLRREIELAQSIHKPKARARQAGFVAKLLRGVDLDALEEALDGTGELTAAEEDHFRALERWRRRMLDDDQAIEDFLDEHPQGDRQRLRQRVRQARKEVTPGKAFKALYQALREASEG